MEGEPKSSEGFFWKIPLTSVLFRSDADCHYDAAVQLGIILLLAFLPVFIVAMADALHLIGLSHTGFTLPLYFQELDANFKLGELFTYVATLCGPIAWILIKYNRVRGGFKDYAITLIGLCLLWSMSLLLFVLYHTNYVEDWHSIGPIAYGVLVMTICLAYVSMVQEGRLPDIEAFEKASKKSAEDLAAQVARRRRR